jgi:two-component system, sensor histidine kinase PdtaS
MTIDTAMESVGISRFAKGNLRLENQSLRRLLAKTEESAMRSAMLLRECDHRVKNSLQIVASLLLAQARREESISASIALRGAAARIGSVAGIHDALQESGGHDWVDLGAVLETMCKSLHSIGGSQSVTVLVSAEPIRAPVAIARPILLAVNELVINALRHAFPDNRSGVVHISVTQINSELHIVVADDGPGLPDNYAEGRGYGMKLVRTMAEEICGVLTVENKSGARFVLSAPAPIV